MMITALLWLWIALNIICYIVGIMFLLEDATHAFNFSFVNPLIIYKNIKVNWFGTVVLTIVLNIVFVTAAVPYWIYKLCTCGRR